MKCQICKKTYYKTLLIGHNKNKYCREHFEMVKGILTGTIPVKNEKVYSHVYGLGGNKYEI